MKSIDGKVVARRPKGGYYFDPVNPPLETITEPGLLAKHKETIFFLIYLLLLMNQLSIFRAEQRFYTTGVNVRYLIFAVTYWLPGSYYGDMKILW